MILMIRLFFVLTVLQGFCATAQEQNSDIFQAEGFYRSFSGELENEKVRLNIRWIDGNLTAGFIDGKGVSYALESSRKARKNGVWVLKENKEEHPLSIKFQVIGDQIVGSLIKNSNQNFPLRLKENYEGITKFTYYSYLLDHCKDSEDPDCPEIKISFVFPKAVEENSPSKNLNQEIKKIIGIKENISFESGIKEVIDKVLKSIETNAEETAEESFSDLAEWNYSQDIQIEFNELSFIILSKTIEEFYGGAHPVCRQNFFVFDLQNLHLMKLEHLISVDSEKLQNLIEDQFRQDFNLKPEEELGEILFEDNLPVSSNFRFDRQGIYFIYNPYEVGAYALGKIEVFISYEKIKSALNPEFARRLKISTSKTIN